MRRWRMEWQLELRIAVGVSFLLVPIALLLIGLTHGVLELAVKWQQHFIENCESFLPIASALVTAPLLLADHEAGMSELTATLPKRRILHVRFAALWALMWALIVAALCLMDAAWGPVPLRSGLLAAFGPALFLSALAVWGLNSSVEY